MNNIIEKEEVEFSSALGVLPSRKKTIKLCKQDISFSLSEDKLCIVASKGKETVCLEFPAQEIKTIRNKLTKIATVMLRQRLI